MSGIDVSPTYIRRACESSLKRLQTDWIDLYQLHVGDLPIVQAGGVADTLDDLCHHGLIRYYAWSTDDPERGAALANRPRAVAVQFDMNVFEDAPEMLGVCHKHDLAGIVRVPLAMGFLSGKFTGEQRLPADDIRSHPPAWLRYFEPGGRATPEWTDRLNSIKAVLTSGGRTLAQGALAWVWARSEHTIPIPGGRTVAQVEENLRAIEFGPLRPDQMKEIDRLLDRGAT